MADLSRVHPEGAILAPMNVTDDALAALVWAGRIADQLDRSLVLLHVIHEPVEQPGLYRKLAGGDILMPLSELARMLCQRRLRELQAAHPNLRSLAEAALFFSSGVPGPRIVQVAQDQGVALIVMQSRHHGHLDRLLHGSVTEYVLRHSRRPVLELDRASDSASAVGPEPAGHYFAKAQSLIGTTAAPA